MCSFPLVLSTVPHPPLEKEEQWPEQALPSILIQDFSTWRLQETFFDFNLQMLEEWGSEKPRGDNQQWLRKEPSKDKRETPSQPKSLALFLSLRSEEPGIL